MLTALLLLASATVTPAAGSSTMATASVRIVSGQAIDLQSSAVGSDRQLSVRSATVATGEAATQRLVEFL